MHYAVLLSVLGRLFVSAVNSQLSPEKRKNMWGLGQNQVSCV